jgi:predicted lipid-binding transport protein (Tim44 family)
MQELIDRIITATGLPQEKATKALGIVLNLLQTQGNQNKVQELFDKLPGAAELAREHGADGAGRGGGGLLGMLAGGMMGGPLAAISKLTSAGLSMDQIKALGTTTLDYAKEKAGPQLVKDVAGSIPGLSGYV